MYSNEQNDSTTIPSASHRTSSPLPSTPSSNTNENEDLLFVAVSYYLDEDEFEELSHYKRFESTDPGQENEVRRGGYVANAIWRMCAENMFTDHPRQAAFTWAAERTYAVPFHPSTARISAAQRSKPGTSILFARPTMHLDDLRNCDRSPIAFKNNLRCIPF